MGMQVSALSRRKGAGHEREIVNILKEAGFSTKRNLDQVRDGGGDIRLNDWLLECKRRRSIAVYEWWDQCNDACVELDPDMKNPKPALVIRADNRENLVVLSLINFLELIKSQSV